MIVVVMRHGEAEGFVSHSDAARNLTQFGSEQANEKGQRLAKHFNVVGVVASYYNRAFQTGSIVASLSGLTCQETNKLTFSGYEERDFKAFLAGYLAQFEDAPSTDKPNAVVLVSHIPIVYELVADLANSSRSVNFHTSDFTVIDYDTKQLLGHSSYDFK